VAFNTPTKRRFLSQINVTPFVDVMLVLLIIFMVTAPMMQAGIDVELPKVEASAISTPDEPIVITIDSKERIHLGKKVVTAKDLGKRLEAINKARPGRTVLLRADEKVPYGVVVDTIAAVRKAGIDKVGMVTEPAGRR
jgi:biopolymer transport protein TolR